VVRMGDGRYQFKTRALGVKCQRGGGEVGGTLEHIGKADLAHDKRKGIKRGTGAVTKTIRKVK